MTASLTILATFIFSLYLLLTYGIFRVVPPSLSATFYMLEDYKKGDGWWFTGMMFAVAFLVLPPMMEATNPYYQWCAFFPPAAIAFVGAAPQYRETFTERVHVIAANVAAIFGLAWVAFLTPCWYFVPLSALACLAMGASTGTLKSCKTFWLEMIAFLAVFAALLYVTFKSIM